jgi:hypothetical protein
MSDKVSLRDIYDNINDLRKEVSDRINRIDDRVQIVESKTDNLLGKIGIGVMVVSAFISTGVTYLFSFFKRNN